MPSSTITPATSDTIRLTFSFLSMFTPTRNLTRDRSRVFNQRQSKRIFICLFSDFMLQVKQTSHG
jgi:hypothetical protein